MATRIAYLGPAGTHSEEALLHAVGATATALAARTDPAAGEAVAGGDELLPLASIGEAIGAVQNGGAVLAAFVPIENSIEGAVTQTLDTLVHDAPDVQIVGEIVWPVHHCLIAREPSELAAIRSVTSHPQALAQCTRFIREQTGATEVRDALSTSEAVRAVIDGEFDAAVASRLAAAEYGGVVVAENIADEEGNATRFVWLAREPLNTGWLGTEAGERKTSIVFAGFEDTSPGALVSILQEFASRNVNLSKIESRPERTRLGHYLFFADLSGAEQDPTIAAALDAVRKKVRVLRVLGSFAVVSVNGS